MPLGAEPLTQATRDAPESGAATYLVGDLRVDVGQQRVTRSGVEIPLPNLSLRFLVALIQAAPNVLSNESLMEQVWPGLVVSPETINKRANLLRDALGDDTREPRYVAGVRGRGYRLMAPVLHTDTPRPPGGGLAVASASPRRWVALAALVVALATVVGVLRFTGKRSSAEPAFVASTTSVRERTVAVLPFDNISVDPADAYLALGLPEMVLDRLASIQGLSVIARNSSFGLPTGRMDPREIGRRLNSAYLINGSVQREAERLRVVVHIVDATAGTVVWSTHVDRDFREIFQVEDEIAGRIAEALAMRVGEHGLEAPAHVHSANLEAYLAFLRGRVLLGRGSVAESESAVPNFEKAIALDPDFAAAYASLYDARMQAVSARRGDMAPVRKQYHYLIDRALRLDPRLGAAYFARAMWEYGPYDTGAPASDQNKAREADFRQGAALDPSNGRGLAAYAAFLYYIVQRRDEALAVLRRALWVDPMSVVARFTDASISLDEQGARVSIQKNLQVLDLDPDYVPALERYAVLRWLIDGQVAEAIQLIEHAIALDPNSPHLRLLAMAFYLDVGDATAARDAATGLESSARINVLWQMHAGDLRAAALAAYDEAGWTDDSDYCDQRLAAEAIRDYALQTRDTARAVAFLRQKYFFGNDPIKGLEVCNSNAAVYLSQLLAASGQSAPALALRAAAASWNEANEARYLGGSHRLRALLLLLEGKPDAALAELGESFRSGDYVHWWYTLERDPSWQPLQGDARFAAIVAQVHRYIDGQRHDLEILRERGLVPRRPSKPGR